MMAPVSIREPGGQAEVGLPIAVGRADALLLAGLFERLPVVIGLNLAVALGATAVFAGHRPPLALGGWLLAMILTLGLRLQSWRAFRRDAGGCRHGIGLGPALHPRRGRDRRRLGPGRGPALRARVVAVAGLPAVHHGRHGRRLGHRAHRPYAGLRLVLGLHAGALRPAPGGRGRPAASGDGDAGGAVPGRNGRPRPLGQCVAGRFGPVGGRESGPGDRSQREVRPARGDLRARPSRRGGVRARRSARDLERAPPGAARLPARAVSPGHAFERFSAP